MSEFIITETVQQVRKIFLNRPDKFNSFNRGMALQLQEALDDASQDKNIRVILLSGKGKAFCAGQDLTEAIQPDGPGIKKIVDEHYNPIIKKIRMHAKPVVCAVNGVAAGAGANIALACDVVVAASSAAFIQAFSKIGLIPDSGGTFMLPRLIGWQRASALMLLGNKVSAEEAVRMGMIFQTFDDAKLDEEAFSVAMTLAGMPAVGMMLTKRLLNESSGNNLGQQLERERDLQVEAALSYDYREGVKAFLEKRKPVFKGE